MKRIIRNIIICILPMLSFIIGGSTFKQNVLFDEAALQKTDSFLKEFFLIIDDRLSEVSSVRLLTCFSVFLFLGLFLSISLYGATRKYRSLLFLRYGSRKRFYRESIKVITAKSLFIILMSIVFFCVSAFLNGIEFNIPIEMILSLAIFIANIFLFFVMLGLLNFFTVMRFKDETAIVAVTLTTSILLITDAYEPFFAIITFGGETELIKGTVFLIISCIVLHLLSIRTLEKNDVI